MTRVAMVKLDIRGVVKVCGAVRKEGYEESVLSKRDVWLPPSGETKLFIPSGKFSHLTMRAN